MKPLPRNLKQVLNTILDTQISMLGRMNDMDAQLHALQVVLLSLPPEHKRLHAAKVLQQTFEEQRALRHEALEQFLQQLALLRAEVSKLVN